MMSPCLTIIYDALNILALILGFLGAFILWQESGDKLQSAAQCMSPEDVNRIEEENAKSNMKKKKGMCYIAFSFLLQTFVASCQLSPKVIDLLCH